MKNTEIAECETLKTAEQLLQESLREERQLIAEIKEEFDRSLRSITENT